MTNNCRNDISLINPLFYNIEMHARCKVESMHQIQRRWVVFAKLNFHFISASKLEYCKSSNANRTLYLVLLIKITY